ncbi:DUF3024 domain-containing protein [Taklimakanibacter deserti]|uniref:DUF3024 domain-containing protein n=1 Tax=Taklimakanibacter deserti TaxID=2267839 RepID=UPI000E658940
MAKRKGQWVWVRTLSAEEKADIAVACERIITELFKPRFLPEIRPTSFNYPVDIFGRWRGNKYSFITRYRSGFPENAGEEFDMAFTRLDHIEESAGEHRFNVMWHRHTGQWWRLHSNVSLAIALDLIGTNELLHPL